MNKQELLTKLEQANSEMKDWAGLNKFLWKKAFNERKELLLQLKELEKVKPFKKSVNKKHKGKKTKATFKNTDVNKDGKTDVRDAVEVFKGMFKKKN